jgi:hypothetical protein
MSFAADLNSVQVELDDLILAMRTVHELPPEERDFEGRMLAILRLFEGAGPQKCQAIYYRLAALSKIIASGDLPYFVSPECPDGSALAQGVVGQAATIELLLFSEHEAYFDPKSFQDRMLSLVEPDCHA